MSVERKCQTGELVCVSREREKETSVWTSNPMWAVTVKRKHPYGRAGPNGPWQRAENVCMDK